MTHKQPHQHLQKQKVFSSLWDEVFTYALIGCGFVFVAFFAYWWFSLSHIPDNYVGGLHLIDFALFGLLTFVVWYQITNEMLSWEIAFFMRKPVHMTPPVGLKVALCTAFVPGKEPYDVLTHTLHAMKAVKYPHETWILDEGDDPYVKSLCESLGVHHFTRKGRDEYNTQSGRFAQKTKAGNYNAWFAEHGDRYDFVAQHDVDFAPLPQYLDETLGYFNDPKVAFVGTPQIYGNEDESWIAKGASEQAYGFYGPTQQGLFGHDMHLFIGANHVIRVKAHNEISGYSGHIVEDHLTGMRIYSKRWKAVYVPEVLLVGEGPATWGAYFSQQMRWAFGLIDILFRHSPRIFPQMQWKHRLHYFLLQQYYFFGLAQVVGVLLISLYFFFGLQSTSMSLNTLLILYPTFLLFQIGIFLWLQRYYVRPEHESGFHLRGKLLNVAAWPVYFLAFCKALAGHRLVYEVTPKGGVQHLEEPAAKVFYPHLMIGTVSAIGLYAAYHTGNDAPQIVFWAALNTFFMYLVVFLGFEGRVVRMVREKVRMLTHAQSGKRTAHGH